MTINKGLYLLCSIGGIAAYSLFYGVIYIIFYNKIGALRYRGTASSRREQTNGIISGVMLIVILVVFYFMRANQGNMKPEMYFFALLIGLMAGRSLFSLILLFFLPTGMYENGIVTSHGLAFYEKIKKYDIHDSGKPRDTDMLFLRVFPEKLEYFRVKTLIIDRKDKGKVQYILKQKKVSS